MLVMKTVDNRLRMIRLIEKIERNRKFADQMHVKDVSEFKKQSNANKLNITDGQAHPIR